MSMTYQEIINRALELGISEVELYATTQESNSYTVEGAKLDTLNKKSTFSLSIRGIYNEKMCYVSTESLEKEDIDLVLHNLIENAKSLTAPEKEFIFEGGAKYQEVPELKSNYKEIPTASKIDMLIKLEKDLQASDKRIVKVAHCSYGETSSKIEIVNSKGVNLSRESSYIQAVGGVLAMEGDQNTVGYSGDVNSNFEDLELDRIIKEASEEAVSTLGAGFVTSGSYPVVLKRDVATQILSAFSGIFSAETVIKKMSILTDKIGTKVFGENINIIDDPFTDKALIQCAFDDEAVPCEKKLIVENGVFKGFLHSQKTANALGAKLTGNGFKSGASISPQPTNPYLEPGKYSLEEIIATIENGIYVTSVAGLHAGLNPISGDFNVQASGYLVENGKQSKPVTLFVISGNFFEMLNNVEMIGNDLEKRFINVASPALKIKSLQVSGK